MIKIPPLLSGVLSIILLLPNKNSRLICCNLSLISPKVYPLGFTFIYSRPSLSRLWLSQIIAYLEDKI